MAEGGGTSLRLKDSIVTAECLEELLEFFSKAAYKAKNVDRRYEVIHKMCLHLMARDYKVEVIDNKAGQLCGHYPSELFVIEGHMEVQQSESLSTVSHQVNNTANLKELFTTARFARCRARFVMPVLLYRDKNICRSSTLSTMAELYGRSGVNYLVTGEGLGAADQDRPGSTVGLPGNSTASNESELLSRVRGQDVQLLKTLKVNLICDLMVENRKIKYGITVSSSEKVDKFSRYGDFHIASLPYPGREFFTDYKDNGFNPVQLHFDWKQPGIDADLSIPDLLQDLVYNIPFRRYQDWDLVEITQNYLKLLLYYLKYIDGGILVHCISGWDRTPLFISLLRLSLWADGEVHQSLSAAEVLYLTLAYDWLVYGHQLKERRERREEILYFCFDFLKFITLEEYSVTEDRPSTSTVCSNDVSTAGSGDTTHHIEIARANSYDQGVRTSPHFTRARSLPDHAEEIPLSTTERSASLPATSHSDVQSRTRTQTVRSRNLNEVRELFLKVYKSPVFPEVHERPGAMSFSGLLSRIANSSIL